MDEIPVCFDLPINYTVKKKSLMIIFIRSAHEKTNFTIVLSCTLDGSCLPPIITFKWKTLHKDFQVVLLPVPFLNVKWMKIEF